jgi:serine protease AprX
MKPLVIFLSSLRFTALSPTGAERAAPKRTLIALSTLALGLLLTAQAFAQTGPAGQSRRGKLDVELSHRSDRARAGRRSRVIVQLENGKALPEGLKAYQLGNRLNLINSYVLDLPDTALRTIAAQVNVRSAHFDRPIWAADYLSTHATAAHVVQQSLGYTGAGVGVAVIDSGIATWHDDLQPSLKAFKSYPYSNQRVSKFVDFVNGQRQPYDDHGHGSHVAGIILGNGFDSFGKQVGMAPDASLVALKVLDKDGKGSISSIIAALDWVVANAKTYNLRVVNLSAGAGVTESYWTDPLTLATKRVVDQGIIVVAAAGNLGKNTEGAKQYGGILCPGNAPWVLTVGASSTQGTVKRRDDQIASFSSLGPTRGDYLAKPDLVAPGYGILSLAVPGSSLYGANQNYLVQGGRGTASAPYLSLSGTSMAAPQVAGAVALMLEANPKLTPNLVRAILQYTAQTFPNYKTIEQGAGFLDTLSAVRLSKFYARNKPGARMPVEATWSQHILWGNHLLSGGYINPKGNAWSSNVIWGADSLKGAAGDDNIVWGTACGDCDNIVWGTADADADNIVWGTGGDDNIVWGTLGSDNIVWGTSLGDDDNIVWGTMCGGDDCDNIVWGTHDADNIVWGTASPDDNIVWGTGGDDNIVWGTNEDDNIVWGTGGDDNIVWGTAGDDNIVWGTAGDDNIVWGTATGDNIVWDTGGNGLWTAEGVFGVFRRRFR